MCVCMYMYIYIGVCMCMCIYAMCRPTVYASLQHPQTYSLTHSFLSTPHHHPSSHSYCKEEGQQLVKVLSTARRESKTSFQVCRYAYIYAHIYIYVRVCKCAYAYIPLYIRACLYPAPQTLLTLTPTHPYLQPTYLTYPYIHPVHPPSIHPSRPSSTRSRPHISTCLPRW